jgi:hypothetical protein
MTTAAQKIELQTWQKGHCLQNRNDAAAAAAAAAAASRSQAAASSSSTCE